MEVVGFVTGGEIELLTTPVIVLTYNNAPAEVFQYKATLRNLDKEMAALGWVRKPPVEPTYRMGEPTEPNRPPLDATKALNED